MDSLTSAFILPKAYPNSDKLRAFVLGCDPTALDENGNHRQFEYVFDLQNDKRYFAGILRNLTEIGLGLKDVYVQNLIREYRQKETSNDPKNWRVGAINSIQDRKREFDVIDPTHTVPVFLTSHSLYEVLISQDNEKYKTPIELYQKKTIINANNNKLGRPLIPLYRHRDYSLCKYQKYRNALIIFLNKQLDPYVWFQYSESYYNAFKILFYHFRANKYASQNELYPLFQLHLQSIELILKAIAIKNGIGFSEEHDISTHFNNVKHIIDAAVERHAKSSIKIINPLTNDHVEKLISILNAVEKYYRNNSLRYPNFDKYSEFLSDYENFETFFINIHSLLSSSFNDPLNYFMNANNVRELSSNSSPNL